MACMEYQCSKCDYHGFGNDAVILCPNDGTKIHGLFDEIEYVEAMEVDL